MIGSIEGRLMALDGGHASVRCGPFTVDVLVPAADQGSLALRVGEDVRFHTICYLEAQGQGTSMTPRLIGFASVEDRAFFELFTTVKGFGNRKALRALAFPIGNVARAIADRDLDFLRSLPEVGKRTAETIVAELGGKVDGFIEAKPDGTGGVTPERAIAREAVAVMAQLGESRMDAVRLVERAMAADPEIETTEALLEAAFKLKELA